MHCLISNFPTNKSDRGHLGTHRRLTISEGSQVTGSQPQDYQACQKANLLSAENSIVGEVAGEPFTGLHCEVPSSQEHLPPLFTLLASSSTLSQQPLPERPMSASLFAQLLVRLANGKPWVETRKLEEASSEVP